MRFPERHPSFLRSRLPNQRGIALMLVLFAMAMLATVLVALVQYLQLAMEENVLVANQFRALHLAESGIALGVHPQLLPGDPNLKQDIGSDSGIEVHISSEEARFPINYITSTGYRDLVYNMFVNW